MEGKLGLRVHLDRRQITVGKRWLPAYAPGSKRPDRRRPSRNKIDNELIKGNEGLKAVGITHLRRHYDEEFL